jgi:hypothetical protein
MSMARPVEEFNFTTQHLEAGIVLVEVNGYMDVESLRGMTYLRELRQTIERVQILEKRSVGLIFKDLLSGFDAGTAAKSHGLLFRDLGERVYGVAIVSTKIRMRFGVAGAKLFAKQPIEIFANEADARKWLQTRALQVQAQARG